MAEAVAKQLETTSFPASLGSPQMALPEVVTCGGQTFKVDSPKYEALRKGYFHERLPKLYPSEISQPTTTDEVSKLLIAAGAKGLKVGVRSGGHLFPACSLLDGGLLIDTAQLNRTIEYNPITKIAMFGPAIQVREAADALTALGRFFPFGHHPTVGLCGFLLAGGQGWFLRGWGCTTDTWIEQLEIVLPNGKIVLASRHQEQDVFWAARGSGQGFFGVVTRIWVRTIPAKKLYDRLIMLDATNDYQPQLEWVLKKCDATVKYGVDIAIVTHYSDLLDPGDHWETKTKRLVLMVALTMYADSMEEVATMTSPWDSIDSLSADKVLAQVPVKQTTWDELFALQNSVFPPRDRWQCDSIITDKTVTYEEVAQLSHKAMTDLPTRKSVGTICVADYYPNEADQALSLPQRYYISTMTRWRGEEEDDQYKRWMRDAYIPLETISAGQYIADFDANQRMSRVMTDSALKKWLSIRRLHDPNEMFPGYRGFKKVLDQEE